jgi:Trypsin
MPSFDWLGVLLSVGVLGGEPAGGAYHDCVAVEVNGSWQSSGVLIGPNVVLTTGRAATTNRPGAPMRVFIGSDLTATLKSRKAQDGAFFWVKTAVRHPDWEHPKLAGQKPLKVRAEPTTIRNDVGLLILTADVPAGLAGPAPLAPPNLLADAKTAVIVGFGHNEYRDGFMGSGLGVKRFATIPIVTLGTRPDDPQRFGITPGKEFVVADSQGKVDGANGDGGAPVYVQKDGKAYLAGILSRAVPPTEQTQRLAGDGSVCVLVGPYKDWIIQTAQKNGGRVGWK